MKEEEEEKGVMISNGMNDDNTSNSDFDNNCIGDGEDNCNINQIKAWGTWEELVLSYAVKRHAFTDWDSVAKEVQLRSRSSLVASAVNCRLKYEDLKRRFQDSVDGGDGENKKTVAEDEVGEISWLEKLRCLRVAELRQEVQLCDNSILSLQLKVKKLEEEKDGNGGDNKPDLGNHEIKPVMVNRETTESDRDNRSINESNSTASVDKIADHERLGGDKTADPDPVYKVASEKEENTVSRRSEMSQSGEMDESGTSKVLGKREGQKYMSGDNSSIRGGSGGDIKSAGKISQSLINFIKLIRSHPRGSLFESRLWSQETKAYKSLIRQHLDIKTIEKKIEKGSYVSSSLSFYRDLKLLFTNAIVFFPTTSSESMAAHELRTLVSNEIKKRTGNWDHSVIKAKAESSVSRQKFSVLPLVACKKKSSASKKTSPSSSVKQKDEKKSQEVSEEKTVTTSGARSSRRTSKGVAAVTKDTKTGRGKSNNKKQTDTKAESSNDHDDEKEETPKTEKKTVASVSDKKKSVADFLKRIKKNSPQKVTSKNQKKSDGNVKKENDNQKKSDGNVKKENDNQKKSVGNVKKENNSKAKPRELRSNSAGKKKVEAEDNNNNKSSSKRKQQKETAEATKKRGRESGKDDKQPKKRSRR